MLLGDTEDGQKWRRLHGEERAFLLGMALYLRDHPGETEVPFAEAVRYSGGYVRDALGTVNVLKIDHRLESRDVSGRTMLSFAGDALSPILTGESQPPLTERRHADLVLERGAFPRTEF